jgi:two-component system NarL family response regulator
MTIRVMLVDDHTVLREALRAALNEETGIEVVGEAGDGEEAVRVAQASRPDVVIMDVGMPNMGGIEATRELTTADPAAKVLALSTHTERHFVLRMLEAGAAGYVVKTADMDEMLHAIRKVAGSGTYISREVAAVMAETVGTRRDGRFQCEPLGPREREVLALVAEGLTSQEIGRRLKITAGTVDVHRHNIMRKLHLHTVAELTKYAIRVGLVSS